MTTPDPVDAPAGADLPAPPVPADSYPDSAPAVPAPEVWTMPNGDTIPKVLRLPRIPGKRDTEITVTFRNPAELRAGDRKAAIAAMPEATNRASAATNLLEATAVMIIDGWDFPALPIPRVTPASLDLLEFTDYDTILDAVEPVLELMFPNPTVGKDGPNLPSEPSSS